MRKCSLLFAAALMACVFQIAYAEEDMDVDRRNPAFMQQNMPFHHGGWIGDPGSRGMMRRGRYGKGSEMPFMRQEPSDGCEGVGCHSGMHFGLFEPRLQEDLGLTAEQKEKIIDVEAKNFRERLRLRWELTEAQAKLRDLSEAEILDYAAIVSVNGELGGLRGKLDVAHRKIREQRDAVLTPEQREKIEEVREDMWEERREHRGRGERSERDERPRKNNRDFRRSRR